MAIINAWLSDSKTWSNFDKVINGCPTNKVLIDNNDWDANGEPDQAYRDQFRIYTTEEGTYILVDESYNASNDPCSVVSTFRDYRKAVAKRSELLYGNK